MASLKKKIACFFTIGWTELNAMKIFLNKINENIEFVQFCPIASKRRKNPLKRELLDKNHEGLTGEKLYEYVKEYIDKYKTDIKKYDAVLIEDDLDSKYRDLYDENDFKDKIEIVKSNYLRDFDGIKKEIRSMLGKDEKFPVYILHASPEIEAWFYADWENSFGYVYGPKFENVLTENENKYFKINFKDFVDKNVIFQYKDNIELYGSFNNQYRKLSSEIIHALESTEFWTESAKEIGEKNIVKYSKRNEGQNMLMSISAEILEKKCNIFFKDVYNDIKMLK